MKIEKREIAALKHPAHNARMHGDKQLNEFVRSLNMFGQYRPAVVDDNNLILVGNGMIMAMRERGDTHADVLVMRGLTPEAKNKLMLVDNRIFYLGMDDVPNMSALITELNGDTDIPGFDADILKLFLKSETELTDTVSKYGVLSPATIQEMNTAMPQPPPDSGNGNNKPIKCPHCGGEIWLS